jgi:biopolymer transport protein ExbB/TolQ
MFKFLAVTGPFGFVLIAVTGVIIALTITTAVRMKDRQVVGYKRFKNGLNGILFWGCMGAVLGLLGQFSGLWRALGAISKADVISPKIVAMGLRESFSTTILGLAILALASLIWFVLKALSQMEDEHAA